ncbi:MAG: diguanylate cyclase [Planctomycetota bacterium]
MPREGQLGDLLAIDPICVLRALRVTEAPILGPERLSEITPRAIHARLGSSCLTLLLAARAKPVGSDFTRLFELWLHSLASAVAARSLCELTEYGDSVDPDEAYTCALLHDLLYWGALAYACGTGKRPIFGTLEWSRMWKLPDKLQLSWLVTQCASAEVRSHPKLAELLLASEAIALLSGFPHPAGTAADRDGLPKVEGPRVRKVVDSLEAGMQTRLSAVGLNLDLLRTFRTDLCKGTTEPVHDGNPPVVAGVLALLDTSEESTPRPRLRRLVDASCQFMRCDRAFFLQWLGKGRTALIRLKQDLSSSPVGIRKLVPSRREAMLLGEVAGSDMPLLLERKENYRYRLLDHIAADAILVVPVAGDSMLHGFLLLDRAYSGQNEILVEEMSQALAFAKVCGQNLTSLLLARRDKRSQKDAYTDVLTGLMNRRAAMSQLDKEMTRLSRNNLPMAILMMDLDRFKSWNDTYGHMTGDRILARIGALLKSTLRGGDTASRIGGEEFLVLQPETTIEEASLVAARIYKEVELAGKELGIPFTISIGLTDLRYDDTIESLLTRADQALYASKEYGRNRFSVDSE